MCPQIKSQLVWFEPDGPIARRMLAWHVIWLAALLAAAMCLSHPANADDTDWTEWSRRIKSIDPKSRTAEEEIPSLIQLVKRKDAPWHVRRQAAMTLGRIGQPARAAVDPLADLLQTEGRRDAVTALWATKSLALFGGHAAPATDVLIQQLHDVDLPMEQRQMSLEALAMIGGAHPKAIPTLVRLLEDGPRVTQSLEQKQRRYWDRLACEAIGLSGSAAASALPALIRATRQSSEEVRRTALASIGMMGTAGTPAITSVIDCLIFDESEAVRDVAGTTLGKIGKPALPSLRGLLADQDAGVRWRAIKSIRSIGTAGNETRAKLEACLNDVDAQVQAEAVEALWVITEDPTIIVPRLLRALQERDRNVRIRAYRFLLNHKGITEAAKAELREIAANGESHARTAARKLLAEVAAHD